MLTKPSIVVLGLLCKNPINAYEVIKKIDVMNMKWWFPIGDSTIYVTIKNLEKKKYVTGKIEKAGNMPEKKIYTITEEGRQVFLNTLRNIICSFDYDTVWFSIAEIFINSFTKEEVCSMLKNRGMILDQYIHAMEAQVQDMEKQQRDMVYICSVKRMKEIVKAEKESCSMLIKNFE
ncbi:MAG TPA: PadR family transcriptional regulator [Lachnospiraceae bacterium]|nr:PadR family transcriptional regulator [Lachnospiraceae bacterium]